MHPGPLHRTIPPKQSAPRRSALVEQKELLREWCGLYGIGRKIGGRWAICAPALDMLLGGDQVALKAYLAGNRLSADVRAYFERLGI
jgi:hypothetical protein